MNQSYVEQKKQKNEFKTQIIENLNEKYLSSTQKYYNKENSIKDDKQLNMT